MNGQRIARASVTINAPVANVWDALVNPEAIKQYMFGTNVTADWQEGSPITPLRFVKTGEFMDSD